MQRCLDLARNGLGSTYPNPLVGAVLVHNNKIIGEGWHQQAGQPHAEVNAIQHVKDTSVLKKSTLYVNLEPCSHFGKTPPCSDLIIEKHIPNVVIGMIDPFKKVAGKGIKKLIDAGCNVKVGVLEDKCVKLNKRFLTFHLKKRPYIILKWATSKDGYLSPYQYPSIPEKLSPVWITCNASKQLVHRWRNQEQAILVGANTILADNPQLTTRLWSGNNPIRVILDPNLKVNPSSKTLSPDAETIWVYDENQSAKPPADFHSEAINFNENPLKQLMQILYKSSIQSIIIEGGAFTLNAFIQHQLWDEARVFVGESVFEKGTISPVLHNKNLIEERLIDKDQLKIYTND